MVVISDSGSVEFSKELISTDPKYKHKTFWVVVYTFAMIHIMAIWGFVLVCKGLVQSKTILWSFFLMILSTIGVSVGAHRYFCHKSFKATTSLEVAFVIMQTLAGQLTILRWCRDHRQHHKYSDTDGDPHNSKRGLFFCYMGWLLTYYSERVKYLAKRVDVSDLESNKLVMFQKRYFIYLYVMFGIMIPVFIPVYFFNESWLTSVLVAYFLRYTLHINYTFSLVVWGHNFGTRPYDKNMQPVDSWMMDLISGGDGNHNFHHVFPWDYKTSEGPNLLSMIVSVYGYLGLAYDFKVASPELIKLKIQNRGDGTHEKFRTEEGMASVTAIGPLHPMNPTYWSKRVPEIVASIFKPKTHKLELNRPRGYVCENPVLD